jgi:hypothetical protein
MQFGNKTNLIWYKYEDMGSGYKLIDGTLVFCPMLKDGTLSTDDASDVDWELLEGDYLDFRNEKLVTDRLNEIGVELLNKSRKSELVEYLIDKDLSYFEDPANNSVFDFAKMALRSGCRGYENYTLEELEEEYQDRQGRGED